MTLILDIIIAILAVIATFFGIIAFIALLLTLDHYIDWL